MVWAEAWVRIVAPLITSSICRMKGRVFFRLVSWLGGRELVVIIDFGWFRSHISVWCKVSGLCWDFHQGHDPGGLGFFFLATLCDDFSGVDIVGDGSVDIGCK